MVVNEAMAGGIPVLVSRHCGAAELVLNGVNGAMFDPENPSEFRACMAEWILRSEAVSRSAIQLHVAGWSIEACEKAIFSGISNVLGANANAPPR
jgi:glycosyltransferase involved in cell wall biosynthesis